MKESIERGAPGSAREKIEDPFNDRSLQKPVIAAVNGFAMAADSCSLNAPICALR